MLETRRRAASGFSGRARVEDVVSNDKEVVMGHLEMLREASKQDLLRPSDAIGVVEEHPFGSVVYNAVLGVIGSAAGDKHIRAELLGLGSRTGAYLPEYCVVQFDAVIAHPEVGNPVDIGALVQCRVEDERIPAGATEQGVPAETSQKRILAASAFQEIGSLPAAKGIRTGSAINPVVGARSLSLLRVLIRYSNR